MQPDAPVPVRLAHFSDIHVTVRRCSWGRDDFLNKRLTTWFNLRVLGRGKRFRLADRVLEALATDLSCRPCDRLVFSGDATAMGFEEEIAHAARLLRVNEVPGLAVPGNHDYCTRSAMHAGHFERYFAPWQRGERIGTEVYPFAQRVGHVWLIAVNSATANRWAWDARGAVGPAQLARLEQLLARIEGGPRILVTHYPVALATGLRERRNRGLRDLPDLLKVATAGGVGLWLHGHRHDGYYLAASEQGPFPIICAGSATQSGRWSYCEYAIAGRQIAVSRRVYDADSHGFRAAEVFETEFGGTARSASEGE